MSYTTPTPESLLEDHAWMRRLAASLVRDPATAEDLVQDTWLAALERWPGGKPTRAWLARVLRNGAVSGYRRDSRRRGREADVTATEAVVDGDPVARLESQRLVATAVLDLEEPMRTILLLRYQEGLQPGAIADRLGIPAGTVRSRLSRGLRILRGRLERRCGGDPRLALAPLLGGAFGATAPSIGSSLPAASGTGAISVTGLMAAVALVAVAGVCMYHGFSESSTSRESGGVHAVMLAPTNPVPDAELPGVGEDRVAWSGSKFGTAPGWWVEGSVSSAVGLGGLGTTPATIEVADSEHPQVQCSVVVGENGKAELDVGRLFRHARRLVHTLYVRVDHPEHLPAHLQIPVGRRQRQDGFVGQRVPLAFELSLRPATAIVVGKVLRPAHSGGVPVKVGLFPRTGHLAPIDTAVVAADGSFRLRGEVDEHYHCVAWTSDPARALLPAHAEVVGGAVGEPLELRLRPGEVVAGSMEGYSLPQTGRLRLRIRHGGMGAANVEGVVLDDVAEELAAPKGRLDPEVSWAAGSPQSGSPRSGPPQSEPPPPEGLEVAARWPVEARFRSLPVSAPFQELFRFGDGYVHQEIQVALDGRGQFSTRGFAKGQWCVLASVDYLDRGDSVPVCELSVGRTGGLDRYPPVFVAPRRGWKVPSIGPVLPVRFVGAPDSGPLRFRVQSGGEKGETRSGWFETDEARRCALFLRDHKPESVEFEVPFYSAVAIDTRRKEGVEDADWTSVVLAGGLATGDLRLNFDEEGVRRVEALSMRLVRVDQEGETEIALPAGDFWRRRDDSFALRAIPAGSYILEFEPCVRGWYRDTEAFAVGDRLAFDVTGGSVTRRVVTLRSGGLLQISDPGRLARSLGLPVHVRTLGARLSDAAGREIFGGFGGELSCRECFGETATDGRISVEKSVHWNRTLSPGAYVLELWPTDLPGGVRRVEFAIKPHEVTSLEPPR